MTEDLDRKMPAEEKELEEDDYNEEEDEDYQVNGSGDESAGEEDGEDGDEDNGEEKKEIQNAKYDKIVSSEGGLIKTRTQRAKELLEEKQFKKAEEQKSTLDIDSFWKEMNSKPKNEPSSAINTEETTTANKVEQPEKIKIKSTYEFAGNIITEDKWVDSNSAEAKAYLNSVKLKDQPNNNVAQQNPLKGLPLPLKKGVRRKRPSLFDAVINDEKALKLSTLEKSRLDWSSYVDKEGIQDDLKNNNKGGYLQKQDFLNRVQRKLDDNYKAAQQSNKK